MTERDLLRHLRETLHNSELEPATVLSGTEMWDSLGQIEVQMMVEDKLGWTIPARALQDVTTVDDLIRLVAHRLN